MLKDYFLEVNDLEIRGSISIAMMIKIRT